MVRNLSDVGDDDQRTVVDVSAVQIAWNDDEMMVNTKNLGSKFRAGLISHA